MEKRNLDTEPMSERAHVSGVQVGLRLYSDFILKKNSEETTCFVYGQHFQQSIDQPGMVVNPARGQLKRENEYFPVPVHA